MTLNGLFLKTRGFVGCVLNRFFHSTILENDNEFIKCIKEMSQYPGFPTRIHDRSLICTPFEINDDDNDFIGYQGDWDPDKYHFH